MEDNWVKIGIVGKAHGLYGAFFIAGRKDSLSKSLSSLKAVSSSGQERLLSVRSIKQHNLRSVVQCDEISGRDQLEAIKGFSLYCPKDQIPITHHQEYLWQDLVDRQVIDMTGQLIGKVVRVSNFGASDIVELKDKSGRTLAIPLVADYFDMGFAPVAEQLKLKVAAEIFDDAWQDDA